MRAGRLARSASGAYSIESEPTRLAPVLAGRLAIFGGKRARRVQPAGQEQEAQTRTAPQRSRRASPSEAVYWYPRPGGSTGGGPGNVRGARCG